MSSICVVFVSRASRPEISEAIYSCTVDRFSLALSVVVASVFLRARRSISDWCSLSSLLRVERDTGGISLTEIIQSGTGRKIEDFSTENL